MPVFKDEARGTWYVMVRYQDWTGERKQKCKRGFATKREAQEWERSFQMQTSGDLDMTFEAFTELYTKDVKPRLKENTWLTKENIIQKKILPYFGKRKISEITTKDVIAWQNELLAYRDEKRKPYSATYLKTLHNQLSAIFNHAVRFYELRSNPAAKAGNMGSEERKEMLFWTKAEYQKFADAMMDKPVSYYAFEMLYWCGIREGELLALTPADFDFEAGTVKISKSYQRLHGKDVITTPKTKKSNRTIKMPNFLCDEMKDYLGMLYGIKKKERIFTITKSYLHHEMDRGAKSAGVKRKFDMISGTNGLLGAADGAFLLQKEKRTDGSAVLDVAGRDQQDQRFYLTKDKERLIWTLERTETEAWTEPPDPVLEAIAALVTVEKPTWGGTATELVAALQTDMKPNALAMRLNVRAGKLLTDYHIRYENSRSHAGRSISLTLEPSQA